MSSLKMQYSFWEKKNLTRQIIEADTEAKAFDKACELYGINGFTDFERYYPGQNSRDHKLHFMKRAISNIPKHLHKQQRHKQ